MYDVWCMVYGDDDDDDDDDILSYHMPYATRAVGTFEN